MKEMRILVVRKAEVEKVSAGLWEKLDAFTHPDLGGIDARLSGLKPALLAKDGNGSAEVVFHVRGKGHKLVYCDEISPEAVELSDDDASFLKEVMGPYAYRLAQAHVLPIKILAHERKCCR